LARTTAFTFPFGVIAKEKPHVRSGIDIGEKHRSLFRNAWKGLQMIACSDANAKAAQEQSDKSSTTHSHSVCCSMLPKRSGSNIWLYQKQYLENPLHTQVIGYKGFTRFISAEGKVHPVGSFWWEKAL
jgi:hypothetical protein